MPKPHQIYTIHTPDAVAECFEGVSDTLYRRLWELVPQQMKFREEPCWGEGCLADSWSKLSEAEQTELNQIAEANA